MEIQLEMISQALANTLHHQPEIRLQAESILEKAKIESDQFSIILIQISNNQANHLSIRQAAALAFKNYIKSSWSNEDEEDQSIKISSNIRISLKQQLIDILISLSNAPNLQIQFQESISIIAQSDFPDQWDDLIDQLVKRFTPNDWKVNNALLSTAHAIFKRWRSEFRTDTLFLQIKFVLERFCDPYLKLFKHLDSALSNDFSNVKPKEQSDLTKSLLYMIQLYYDLNSQDIPEFFEDNLSQFMTLLHKYLTWNPILIDNDQDEDEVTDIEKIKSSICEVIELYSQRYLDVFPMMGTFAETCWSLLTQLGQQQRYDILVSKATRFLSVVVRMSSQKALFEADATLEAFCEKIVLPNMILRDFEVEMFEDDPTEYVRRDLEGSDNDTRRQAATNFTRALMEQFETKVTQIITTYVQNHLQEYAINPTTNWKSKDAAISLLASVASRSSTSTGGVTSTNSLVDVVRFFSEHVVQDLSTTILPHQIILSDAIKFLNTFRNQLTRDQLLSVLPLLSPHLNSDVMVIYTYAAHTIERILFIKRENRLLFSANDIQVLAPQLLSSLFNQIRKGSTPQLVAQNDVLMKCVMRIIVTARRSLITQYTDILSNLIGILVEISKNPSNPKFNHYTFESISALIRFMTIENAVPLSVFENALFPSFSNILTQDIQDFSPFVFQILSQLLELHSQVVTNTKDELPEFYINLLQPLLTPTIWEIKGNIPALVRLLKAYLNVGSVWIIKNNRVSGLLGVYQKLIGSKLNDQFGFDLLLALFEHIPMEHLSNYLRNIFIILLTRLQSSKTDKFNKGLNYFLMYIFNLEKPDGIEPDLIINTFNSIQPGLFCQVMEGVILPTIIDTPIKERRVVELGHVSLLTRSRAIQIESESRLYLPILSSLLKLFNLPNLNISKEDDIDLNDEIKVSELEENGYQVGFSVLGASEVFKKNKKDLFESFGDPRDALARGLVRTGEAQPGKIPGLISQVDANLSTPYLQWLSAAGYQIK
ncbi:hypothetical protein CROQUDRAFT_671687 [Cronartium quercuum f. sp. fusiforme G11]|uniref:Importin N-terminal domain-containing protein n=1 Tax=Cronartium quercuum f. sp. fusiforme G11 TaxID=708437 RepID=A0A9P6NGJ8_9BASI|nr:hypothetical protein CROQUDRAFT_671687 [Cronartium quercuum f. sp. fusiforme G11]